MKKLIFRKNVETLTCIVGITTNKNQLNARWIYDIYSYVWHKSISLLRLYTTVYSSVFKLRTTHIN